MKKFSDYLAEANNPRGAMEERRRSLSKLPKNTKEKETTKMFEKIRNTERELASSNYKPTQEELQFLKDVEKLRESYLVLKKGYDIEPLHSFMKKKGLIKKYKPLFQDLFDNFIPKRAPHGVD